MGFDDTTAKPTRTIHMVDPTAAFNTPSVAVSGDSARHSGTCVPVLTDVRGYTTNSGSIGL